MPLATLSIDLEARLASLERGFDKAYRTAEKNAAQMEARYAKVGAAMTGIARTITAAFAGISVVALVKGTTDALDAFNDLKDATGSSIENLSALEDVALRTGTSYDSMAGALVKFNNTLKEAKPGSDAERVIKALGLDVEKLKALDPAEALRQVAVALSGYADDGDKARAVQELFGKSVREVAPFLADLAKQGQLNAKVTTEQAEAAERFNQQLASMRKDVTDAARAIVGDMLPALSEFLRQLTEGRKAFGSFSSALFSLGTSRTFSSDTEALRFYREELEKAKGAVEAIEAGADGGRFSLLGKDRLEAAKQNVAEVQKYITYYQRLLGLTDGSAGGGRGNVNPGDAGPPRLRIPDALKIPKAAIEKAGQIDDSTRALAAYVSQLDRQLQATQDLTEEQEALNFLKSLGNLGEIPQVREIVLGLAAQNDALKEQEELRRLNIAAAQEQARVEKQINDEFDRLSGRADDARKVRLTEALEKKLQENPSAFTPEELDRIVKGIAGISGEIAKTNDIANELGLTFSSAFEDAIVGGGKFSDVLKGLEQDIIRIVTRKLVTEPLGNAISGAISAGTSGGGFDLSAVFSNLFSGFFAQGGYIPPGRWGVVGERGPEPAFGGRTGLTVQSNGGSGMSISQQFVISGPMDKRTQAQVFAAASRGARAATMRGTA